MSHVIDHKEFPNVVCPYCRNAVHPKVKAISQKDGETSRLDRRTPFDIGAVVECTSAQCERQFFVKLVGTYVPNHGRSHSIERIIVWPIAAKNLSEHIPKDVAEDFNQAYRCWNMGMDRAATLMVRRCVENACRTAGAQERSLIDMIDELKGADRLHPMNANTAHGARMLGNNVAHILRDIKGEEIKICLDLIEKVLDDLFVTPKLQEQIAAAAAKPKP